MANNRKSRRAFFGLSDRPSGGPRGGSSRRRGNGRNGDGRRPPDRRRNGRGDGSGRRRKGGSWRWRLFRWAFVAAIWLTVGVAGLVAWYAYDLPELESIPQLARRPSVTLVAADGSVFAYYGDTAGPPVPIADMPRHLPQAVLAIEDRRFYSHPGLDIIGLMRAIYVNVTRGELSQGGSTITQQLAKNVFLTRQRTLKRKVQEVLVAFWLERKFSKDEILALYLNRVYLGAGTFGVSAAADRYFGKPVNELRLSEAAMLAGLLQAPSRYAPTRDMDRALNRSHVVLEAMVDVGYISETQARQAKADPIKLARAPDNVGRYFADWALDQVSGYIGTINRDIVVKTTLDAKLQRATEQKLHRMIEGSGAKAGVEQAAAVVMSPDGAMRALVGGTDYSDSQFNRAVRALRQPGSAFKPFVYLAALEGGFKPDAVFLDEPVKIGDFQPRNYDGTYRGAVTLEQALAHSINTVAVRLLNQVGVDRVIGWAKRLGITSPLKREAGLALGASEVTLLELTAAYGTFAAEGAGVWPYAVTEVTDSSGAVIYRRLGSGSGLRLDSRLIADMNRMLTAVVQYGTGRAANTGRPVAGKTGTTDDYRDAWFIGYSADHVAGVWMGNDDRTPMKKVTGGGLPAQLWKDIMLAAESGTPEKSLPQEEPQQRRGPVQSIWDNLFGAVMSLGGGSSQRNSGERAKRSPPVVHDYPSGDSRRD